jgi:ribose-phosphate pyrophosphokinase
LAEAGARRVLAAATHPVLSGSAIERIKHSALEEVVVTDTIPLQADARETGKFRVLTVAGLLGEAIKRIHNGDSVSSLFD